MNTNHRTHYIHFVRVIRTKYFEILLALYYDAILPELMSSVFTKCEEDIFEFTKVDIMDLFL